MGAAGRADVLRGRASRRRYRAPGSVRLLRANVRRDHGRTAPAARDTRPARPTASRGAAQAGIQVRVVAGFVYVDRAAPDRDAGQIWAHAAPADVSPIAPTARPASHHFLLIQFNKRTGKSRATDLARHRS